MEICILCVVACVNLNDTVKDRQSAVRITEDRLRRIVGVAVLVDEGCDIKSLEIDCRRYRKNVINLLKKIVDRSNEVVDENRQTVVGDEVSKVADDVEYVFDRVTVRKDRINIIKYRCKERSYYAYAVVRGDDFRDAESLEERNKNVVISCAELE